MIAWLENQYFQGVCPQADVTIIAGYKFKEYVKKYPKLNFFINLYWEKTKSITTSERFIVDTLKEVLITYEI